MRVEDKLGPYKTQPECFNRGAMIVRDTSARMMIGSAQAYCSEGEEPGKLFERYEKKQEEQQILHGHETST